MKKTSLMKLTYFDPEAKVRLTNYADIIVYDEIDGKNILCAARLGGYTEAVTAMTQTILGGGTLELENENVAMRIQAASKHYRKQISHDGVYAEVVLVIKEDPGQDDLLPYSSYIFCDIGDRKTLFEAIDKITAVPLIPEYQDYVLMELERRGILRPIRVLSFVQPFEAWALQYTPGDKNIISVIEDGRHSGVITVPKAVNDLCPLDGLNSVTEYLNRFGVSVAERIRKLFVPLFDPGKEPLSKEVLRINESIKEKAGYPLYDAQLAVAESVKRQLARCKAGLIIAECGSGKTKIGMTAMTASAAVTCGSQKQSARAKTFNVVLCPSHVAKKWVREIEGSLPDTFAAVVRSITQLDILYKTYEDGSKDCYAIISKEKARDGYMRMPAVSWKTRLKGFICPDCGEVVQMAISDDGIQYLVNADQFFFKQENSRNHKCTSCGSLLWTAINPDVRTSTEWIKIGGYGFVHRDMAAKHLEKTKNAVIQEKITEISKNPNGYYKAKGAYRCFPLSTYIKKKYKGKIYGVICDELHQYAQNSGQGDAMAELYQAARKVVGMTATLINGYSSGIFYLLYRMAAPLMKLDGKEYSSPASFNAEYGVIQNVYNRMEADYNSNRRSSKSKKMTRQLPGVSPLVYSRFLLEKAAFLSLTDMGKDLPEYEEIAIPLSLTDEVRTAYEKIETVLKKTLRNDKKAAKKILSTYLNLLTAYPDQPYGHDPILHPISHDPIIVPPDVADFNDLSPKDEAVLEIVKRKIRSGEKMLIYTNWIRLDTQAKLLKILTEAGYNTEVLPAGVKPEKREEWVDTKLKGGLDVLITNPNLVETGLDLNAFTTLIFYDTGYKLFTLRQASRRSWRINQTAPRVEVYMLFYTDTMQHKAMKLMASKLAVAGIIEGSFSDEGLAAMSECEDMTTIMAKELMLGIKDSVEDISAAFKRMAVLKPKEIATSKQKKEIKIFHDENQLFWFDLTA